MLGSECPKDDLVVLHLLPKTYGRHPNPFRGDNSLVYFSSITIAPAPQSHKKLNRLREKLAVERNGEREKERER